MRWLLTVSFFATLGAPAAQCSSTLKAFFTDIGRKPGLASSLTYDELLKPIDEIASDSPETIEAALHVIVEDLKHEDDQVAVDAAFAIVTIARRPDGTTLLAPYIQEIGGLLKRSDTRLHASAIFALTLMFPPAPEATGMLTRFISANPDAEATPAAAQAALQMSRTPETMAAVRKYFASRSSNVNRRVASLQALALARSTDPELIGFVVTDLSYPDDHVILAAIHAVTAIGDAAMTKARSRLLQLATDAGQSEAIRKRAEEALTGREETSEGPPESLVPPEFQKQP
jgi:hypothetical protein